MKTRRRYLSLGLLLLVFLPLASLSIVLPSNLYATGKPSPADADLLDINTATAEHLKAL